MTLPYAVIIDLDGTLSSVEWRVPLIGDPPNWQRFNDALTCDAPIVPTVTYANYCYDAGIKVILLTGRTERNRYITEFWLAEHKVNYDLLVMRENHVFDSPAVVKQALYEAHIKGRYEVIRALDDHDEVIEMWKSLGIKAILVTDPCHAPLYQPDIKDNCR